MKNNSKRKPLPLEELLNHGSENAINTDQIARYYGMTRRNVYEIIQAKRNNGIPILAKKNDGGGFYLPETEQELIGYIRRCNAQIETQQYTRDSLIRYYEQEYEKPYYSLEWE